MRPASPGLLLLLGLAACSPATAPHDGTTARPGQAPASAPQAPPAPPAQVKAAAANPQDARIAALNGVKFDSAQPPAAATPDQPSDLLIKAEVLLARARFSPGVVDGRDGSNLDHALSAYQADRGLDATGMLDAVTWAALAKEPNSGRAIAQAYAITPADVQGPFAPDVGENFVKLAALPDGPQFSTPLEELAERFHMSQALLTALNPGVDFKTAGARIIVVDVVSPAFSKGDVASVTVSKAKAGVEAFDKDGKLLAFYPATVGSTERPSPSGVHKVNGVTEQTAYVYDPAKLTWGPRGHGKLTIKPGPNNPVGTVWIDLNAPSYGIHGSPNPETIGKTASHGCVRLTNWDAEALAAGVKPGVQVTFEGHRGETRA